MIADPRNTVTHSADRVRREQRAVLVDFEAFEVHAVDDLFREERPDRVRTRAAVAPAEAERPNRVGGAGTKGGTDVEFATILADEVQACPRGRRWKEDEDRSPAVEFRIDIESTNGWPLFVKGRYNVAARTLTYALILKTAGRIYGLDLGKDHHNPQSDQVGEKHKHRWSERLERVLCRGTHSARWQHEATAANAGGIVVMDASNVCQDLQRRIGALFTCSDHGDYQRIRTPYLYPDGDNIGLFCKVDGDTVTVSDLAETTGWLRVQSAALRRSPKQTRLIEDACVAHGIEFYRGMLQARCRPGDELAQVVTRVAQAALRVSDLWFTFRTQAIESITDEVADFRFS